MQVKCPACNAAFSLEAALAIDAGRSALMTALQMPAPLAMLWAQYLALFRAPSRALAFDRADRLMSELLPMLASSTVVRDGVTRPAPLPVWQQGIERMLELRNSNKLQLPLKSHGYLLEIVAGLAEQQAAAAERLQEADRRVGRHREQGSSQVARIEALSRIRGDLELGLITREVAEERLRAAGINPEALNG
jgi:hypothetical protein